MTLIGEWSYSAERERDLHHRIDTSTGFAVNEKRDLHRYLRELMVFLRQLKHRDDTFRVIAHVAPLCFVVSFLFCVRPWSSMDEVWHRAIVVLCSSAAIIGGMHLFDRFVLVARLYRSWQAKQAEVTEPFKCLYLLRSFDMTIGPPIEEFLREAGKQLTRDVPASGEEV